MINRKSWEDFRATGLLWFVNSFLHAFGWSLVVELEGGVLTNVYPARVKYRGFSEEITTKGHIDVATYLKENADELLEEAKQ